MWTKQAKMLKVKYIHMIQWQSKEKYKWTQEINTSSLLYKYVRRTLFKSLYNRILSYLRSRNDKDCITITHMSENYSALQFRHTKTRYQKIETKSTAKMLSLFRERRRRSVSYDTWDGFREEEALDSGSMWDRGSANESGVKSEMRSEKLLLISFTLSLVQLVSDIFRTGKRASISRGWC